MEGRGLRNGRRAGPDGGVLCYDWGRKDKGGDPCRDMQKEARAEWPGSPPSDPALRLSKQQSIEAAQEHSLSPPPMAGHHSHPGAWPLVTPPPQRNGHSARDVRPHRRRPWAETPGTEDAVWWNGGSSDSEWKLQVCGCHCIWSCDKFNLVVRAFFAVSHRRGAPPAGECARFPGHKPWTPHCRGDARAPRTLPRPLTSPRTALRAVPPLAPPWWCPPPPPVVPPSRHL